MDDKKTAMAVIVCIAVIMLYSQLVIDPYIKRGQPQRPQTAGAPVATPTLPPVLQSPLNAAATAAAQTAPSSQNPSPADINASPVTIIDTPASRITLVHLGARLASYELKNYQAKLGQPALVDMVSKSEKGALPLGVYVGGMSDAQVAYNLESAAGNVVRNDNIYSVEQNAELVLTFSGKLPSGNSIKKTFHFCEAKNCSPFAFDLNVRLGAPSADGSRLWVEWTSYLPANYEHERLNTKQIVVLGDNDKIQRLTDIAAPLKDLGLSQWASYADLYFTSTFVPKASRTNIMAGRDGEMVIMRTSGNADSGDFLLYVGPKDYNLLKRSGYQLERNIDLGTFTFLAYPLLALIRVFNDMFGNPGLAIVLLTLIIKTLFLPLTIISFRSMLAMQNLQPEVQALKERIKDPTELNQQMMALYKKRGVNPMGGCLPIVIQIPVFLGLYNALINAIELRHAPFALWINDLSANEFLHIPWIPIPIPVLTLFFGASMVIQQKLTPQTALDPTQKKIINSMPYVFTAMFIFFPFPAGLVLYWLVNNLISIVQQQVLRKASAASPLMVTLIASAVIFGLSFVLTLLPKI